jgi:predicted membrane channel-forming protein YqfA (hemolysin III family)
VDGGKAARVDGGEAAGVYGCSWLLTKLILWFLAVWVVVRTCLQQSTEPPLGIILYPVGCCSLMISISIMEQLHHSLYLAYT